MTSRLTEINVDCTGPAGLAGFWCAALGYSVLDATDDLVEVGPDRGPDAELLDAVRREPVAPSMFFALVPERKTVKNRLHLDLSPVDCTQAEEVARLEALGARREDVGQTGAETWVVMPTRRAMSSACSAASRRASSTYELLIPTSFRRLRDARRSDEHTKIRRRSGMMRSSSLFATGLDALPGLFTESMHFPDPLDLGLVGDVRRQE